MKFTLLLFFISLPTFASYSAKRLPNETFEQAVQRYSMRVQNDDESQTEGDVFMTRIPLSEVDQKFKERIPEFSSFEELEAAFKWSRDERFMEDPRFEHFLRRISWLYPDDGCFARAQVAQKIIREHVPESDLGKVFIFGSLHVETKNSPDGSVSWWYHVVPASRIGEQIWIMDAAIDPTKLLKLEEWIAHMVREGNDDFTVNFCKNEAYGPGSSCLEPRVMDIEDALIEQAFYLREERERLLELERNPDEELGHHPPWLIEPTPQPGKPKQPLYTPLH